MKKIILSTSLALLGLGLFSSALQAKECFTAKSIDVTWISYKTMAKIGVGGNFSSTLFTPAHKDASSTAIMLQGATVKLSLINLDAHNATKNSNIAEFFVANLSAKEINAKIVSADDKKLTVAITLNKKTHNIPMHYTIKNSKIIAKGVIDALDFDLVPALRTLNKNVAGHKNKGWNDIAIAFDMPFTTATCK
jgi:hypothetical protein